jgi:hypothetical protein
MYKSSGPTGGSGSRIGHEMLIRDTTFDLLPAKEAEQMIFIEKIDRMLNVLEPCYDQWQ